MGPLVLVQIGEHREAFLTPCALVWFLSPVRLTMMQQDTFLLKVLTTFHALVGLLPVMDSLMHVQAGAHSEAFLTLCTLVHFHPRMGSLMTNQNSFLTKALPAFEALMGLLP